METASQYLAFEFFFDNWIRLSKIEESFEGLRELILVEKFLHSCPRELALFIRERAPSDMKHLLELARSLLQHGPLLKEMLSHTSLTAIPILDRIVNLNRIGRILDQIGINIREEVCVTCARNLVIEQPLVQLGDHKGMTIECDSRFTIKGILFSGIVLIQLARCLFRCTLFNYIDNGGCFMCTA